MPRKASRQGSTTRTSLLQRQPDKLQEDRSGVGPPGEYGVQGAQSDSQDAAGVYRAVAFCGRDWVMSADVHDDLDRLVGALCDGTLTAEEYARLDALLAGDDEARRFYNDYI